MVFTMFSIFKKDPAKKLQKEYMAKLELGMLAQRNGDIKLYSEISTEAEAIRLKIEALKNDAES
ncbi:MAG: hypothetical protein ACJA0E_000491 [Bermanella sp.]|jgi:hypothetical protein